jgi:hypothetical protein
MISAVAAQWSARAVVCLLAAGLPGVSAHVSAQPSGPGGPAGPNATVEVATVLTLTGLAPGFALTGDPGETVTGNPVALNVETNNESGYVVTIQSRTPAMVASTRGNEDSIPIGAVSVRGSGASAHVALSDTTPVTAHRRPGPTAEGGDDLGDDFQAVIPDVERDTYVATLDYVAATL